MASCALFKSGASVAAILSLACTQMKLTPAEALTCATVNAAYSLNRGAEVGSGHLEAATATTGSSTTFCR